MARPTKFTPSTAAKILDVIACGCGREVAVKEAKIGRRTLVTWLTKGEAGNPTFVAFAAQAYAAEDKVRTRRVG